MCSLDHLNEKEGLVDINQTAACVTNKPRNLFKLLRIVVISALTAVLRRFKVQTLCQHLVCCGDGSSYFGVSDLVEILIWLNNLSEISASLPVDGSVVLGLSLIKLVLMELVDGQLALSGQASSLLFEIEGAHASIQPHKLVKVEVVADLEDVVGVKRQLLIIAAVSEVLEVLQEILSL